MMPVECVAVVVYARRWWKESARVFRWAMLHSESPLVSDGLSPSAALTARPVLDTLHVQCLQCLCLRTYIRRQETRLHGMTTCSYVVC